jgi:hypothetical protein
MRKEERGTIAGDKHRFARVKKPPGMGRKEIISPRVIYISCGSEGHTSTA